MKEVEEKANELINYFYQVEPNIRWSIKGATVAAIQLKKEWNTVEGIEDGSDGSNLDVILNRESFWKEVIRYLSIELDKTK